MELNEHLMQFARKLGYRYNYLSAEALHAMFGTDLQIVDDGNLNNVLTDRCNSLAGMIESKQPYPCVTFNPQVFQGNNFLGVVEIWIGYSKDYNLILRISSENSATQAALIKAKIKPVFIAWGENAHTIKYTMAEFKAESATKPVQKTGLPWGWIFGVPAVLALAAFIYVYVVPNIPGL